MTSASVTGGPFTTAWLREKAEDEASAARGASVEPDGELFQIGLEVVGG